MGPPFGEFPVWPERIFPPLRLFSKVEFGNLFNRSKLFDPIDIEDSELPSFETSQNVGRNASLLSLLAFFVLARLLYESERNREHQDQQADNGANDMGFRIRPMKHSR